MKSTFALALCMVIASGCGTSSESSNNGGSGPGWNKDAGADQEVIGGECNAITQSHPDEGASHVAACARVTFASNPPSSGNHYGAYPAFGVYQAPLPRGYWVHGLEHGAIVITYNCPEGCPDEVEKVKAFLAATPPDSYCARMNYTAPRIILTPDPLLDARWAASSWGFTLRADCFDASVFRAFYDEHVGQASENICSFSIDPRTLTGTLNLPAGCGQ